MKLAITILALLFVYAIAERRDYAGKRKQTWKKLIPATRLDSTDSDDSDNNDNDANVQSIAGVKVGRVSLHRDLESLNRYTSFLEWRNFKNLHSKNYESTEEEHARFTIFRRNKQLIDEHNARYDQGEHTYRLGLNKFADMTLDEFSKTVNGFKRSYRDSQAKGRSSVFLEPLNVVAPDQVDWRQHDYVTPVKDQGHCGSCWAFSSTGALEGQHKRKSGKLVSLSEQNLVDCSEKYGNQGCNGGLMDQAFEYVKDNKGIDLEKAYPYEAKDGRCRFNKTKIGAEDTGFTDVASGDETKLQTAVGTVGPVSVAIDASHTSFQFYNGGVYYEPECSSEALDHGVLAVGYGATPQGDLYWIVKNSWGTGWGEEGYVKIARNRSNHCGIATQASYPLV